MASENFYNGGVYSTDPAYKMNPYGGFTGARMSFGELSTVTDARTANQLKEASETLNTGLKNIEVGAVGPDVFESIPTEHFKEINRMAKLAGAEVTMHAPMIDPTGITQQGWDKMQQQGAERQLWDSIKKSHELNPKKNTVVTFHATSVGLPSAELKIMEDVNGKKTEKIKSILVIDPDFKIGQIKAEESFFPVAKGQPSKDYFASQEEVKTELDRRNAENWMQNLSSMNMYAQRGEEAVNQVMAMDNKYKDVIKEKDKAGPEWKETLEKMEKDKSQGIIHGDLYLRDVYRNIKKNFDDLYKYADAEDKKKLDSYKEKVQAELKKVNFEQPIQKAEDLQVFADMIQQGVSTLRDVKAPTILRPLRDFAIEKSAETAANLALKSYNEFGDTAPIIAMENHPAQTSLLTTGEDLRDVIKKSQEIFVKKAIAEGKMSEEEAKAQAKKLIGATWDVGHINMIRKYGYDKEELVKQTEAVAPFVKKVHLSDNFGFEHTELPMGMGNVPIKEMNAILEKAQKGKEGYDVKKVIEAGNWWQHFSQGSKALGPLMPSLAGMGAPIYSGTYNATANPGWNQIYGIPGGYFSGYGTMLPEHHFQMYGAGFSSMPTELGGQIPGRDSRVTGTPMA